MFIYGTLQKGEINPYTYRIIIMSKQLKKRLCWNCEGSIVVSEETCPFCGVSVIPASLDGPGQSFAPPYQFSSIAESSIPNSPYAGEETHHTEDKQVKTIESSEFDSTKEFKNSLISTLLLLTGSVFFLFGLALVLFTRNGVFTLQWNGNFWFIYLGLSLPLLILGWRSMHKLE